MINLDDMSDSESGEESGSESGSDNSESSLWNWQESEEKNDFLDELLLEELTEEDHARKETDLFMFRKSKAMVRSLTNTQ